MVLKQIEFDAFVHLRRRRVTIWSLCKRRRALATLDVLLGLAETAQLYDHVRPVLDGSRELRVIGGRHPVLEQTLKEEKFVPNDTLMEPETAQLLILTGPNMAGKSTYIRQVVASYSDGPDWCFCAAEAHVGLVDRIFVVWEPVMTSPKGNPLSWWK